MTFEARTTTLRGTIVLNGSVDQVFPLFSPLGERAWVEGWEPEILAPAGAVWEEGMIFRTSPGGRDVLWMIANLDRRRHHVVYYRTEPGHLVARVEVECRATDGGRTQAAIAYAYVGLSDAGNAEIAAWTEAAYAEKMQTWQRKINQSI